MILKRRKIIKDVTEGKGYAVVAACCGQTLVQQDKEDTLS